MSSIEPNQIAASLRRLLNSHGHSFQYAVIRRLEQLHSLRRSIWHIDGVEFPVSVAAQTTHIDFILKSKTGRTYLVVECKRADPAKAHWCFAQAPYTSFNPRSMEVVFEEFSCNELGLVTRRSISVNADKEVYHLGFELRTGNAGDGKGDRSHAINEAITQVLRGVSGLLNHLQESSPSNSKTGHLIRFIPVIITTAQLFVTRVDLGGADLKTGNLPSEAVNVEKVEAVWFTHNRSPALRPNSKSISTRGDFNEFSSALRNEFARSVAIISTDGIDEFMSWNSEEWLWSF